MNGKSILIIEDDNELRDLLKIILSNAGAIPLLAADGEEGLRLFHDSQPDLVILDIMLPGLDGWQVCEEIRRTDNTPVVMLTALKSAEEVARGLACGAVDYLIKPLNIQVLLDRIQAILRQFEDYDSANK